VLLQHLIKSGVGDSAHVFANRRVDSIGVGVVMVIVIVNWAGGASTGFGF